MGEVPVLNVAGNHGIPRHGVPHAHSIEHPPSVTHAPGARVARQQDGARAQVPAGDGVRERPRVVGHPVVAVGEDHGVPGDDVAGGHRVEHLPGLAQAAEAPELPYAGALRGRPGPPGDVPGGDRRCGPGCRRREEAVEVLAVSHWRRLAPFDQKHHRSGASRGMSSCPAGTPPRGLKRRLRPLETTEDPDGAYGPYDRRQSSGTGRTEGTARVHQQIGGHAASSRSGLRPADLGWVLWALA